MWLGGYLTENERIDKKIYIFLYNKAWPIKLAIETGKLSAVCPFGHVTPTCILIIRDVAK